MVVSMADTRSSRQMSDYAEGDDIFEPEVTRSWQKDLIEKEARVVAEAPRAAAAAVQAAGDAEGATGPIPAQNTSIYTWVIENSRLLASVATALATWILLYLWKPQFVESHESRKPFESAKYNHSIIVILGLFAAACTYVFSSFDSLHQ